MGIATAGSALSADSSVSSGSVIRVLWRIRMAIRAMRLPSITLELHVWRPVKILLVRLHYKMGRIAAGWLPAHMAHLLIGRNRGSLQVKDKPMGQPSFVGDRVSGSAAKVAITKGEAVAHPGPAVVWPSLIHLGPEAFLQRPSHKFRTFREGRVSVSLPAAVMYVTPSAPSCGVVAVRNGAVYV